MSELPLAIRIFFSSFPQPIKSPLTLSHTWVTGLVLSNTRQQLFGCVPPFVLGKPVEFKGSKLNYENRLPD
jgi:hypothetical protein